MTIFLEIVLERVGLAFILFKEKMLNYFNILVFGGIKFSIQAFFFFNQFCREAAVPNVENQQLYRKAVGNDLVKFAVKKNRLGCGQFRVGMLFDISLYQEFAFCFHGGW